MAKHQVLIIEDDRPLADVLSYNLEQADFAVTVAHDGQDGLNRAQHKTPDVIVLDLMLPIIDGGKLAGIVSIGDIVKYLSRERETEIRYLQDYIAGRYPG